MRRRLLCEQRGAISVLAGMSLIVVIASAALAVDIGQAAWQKRRLQKTVDVASLDAARALGDRKDSANCVALAQQFAQQAAKDRNGFDYTNAAAGNSLTVATGFVDQATKVFTATANCSLANAVRVVATSKSNNHFTPGAVTYTAEAIASVNPRATFSVGSSLVSLDSTTSPLLNSVLQGMLGAGVNLSLVSYQGLAGGSVKLGPIWTALGLATSDQILGSQVTVKNFLNASATALNNQGDPSSVTAATILGTLATQVDPNAKFKFGDLFGAGIGDPGNAANATLNVLQMVGMVATVANGTNALNLALPINIPGVASMNFKMGVIEPPKICPLCYVGSTPAPIVHTAQVRIAMDLTLLQHLVVLLQQGVVHLPVSIESAGATGELTNVRCAIPASNSDITVHTITQAVSAQVGTITDASLNNPGVPPDIRPAQIVNIAGLVNATGTASATVPGSIVDLLIPLLQTRTAGVTGNLALAGQLSSSLALTVQALGLGVNVGTVTANLLSILGPVLSTLDTTLLTPLKRAFGALGIALGSADVGNLDDNCGGRRLVG